MRRLSSGMRISMNFCSCGDTVVISHENSNKDRRGGGGGGGGKEGCGGEKMRGRGRLRAGGVDREGGGGGRGFGENAGIYINRTASTSNHRHTP